MPAELIYYISIYGYFAIFALVFLQEIGAPNPIPNELVLIFSGYLTFTGVLNLPLVILAALSADLIGTSLLHTVFYFFGAYILQHKPRWLPLPIKAIDRLTQRLSKKGLGSIYLCRLTPFIRGYTSVISGLLQIKHKVFLPLALITAIIWSCAYVITGRLLGPFWGYFISNIGSFKYIMLLVFSITICILILRSFLNRRTSNAKELENKTLL
jgi:membrane protein DedA with SNARE-associated domain